MRNRRWSAVLYRAQGKPGSPVDDLVRAPSLGGKPVHLLQGLPVQVLLGSSRSRRWGHWSRTGNLLQMAKCPSCSGSTTFSSPIVHCKWQCGANGDQQQHARTRLLPICYIGKKMSSSLEPLTSTSNGVGSFFLSMATNTIADMSALCNQDDKAGDKIQLHCAVFLYGGNFFLGIFFSALY